MQIVSTLPESRDYTIDSEVLRTLHVTAQAGSKYSRPGLFLSNLKQRKKVFILAAVKSNQNNLNKKWDNIFLQPKVY